MSWTKIESFKTVTSNGDVEVFHFEKNDNGDFRVINDFGNSQINFDLMSGYEMIKKIFDELNTIAENESELMNMDDFDDDDSYDPYDVYTTAGVSDDSDSDDDCYDHFSPHYGADLDCSGI